MPSRRLLALCAALVVAAAASIVVAEQGDGSVKAGTASVIRTQASRPRIFPAGRNLVTAADVLRAGPGTPVAALMAWTRAVQQRDVALVERLTSTKAAVAPGTLAAAVRSVGPLLAYPSVTNQLVLGTTATLAVQLQPFVANRADPALSIGAVYVLDRERSAWRVRSVGLLLRNAADLRRLRRS